jgi:Pilus formation protein N terminal region
MRLDQLKAGRDAGFLRQCQAANRLAKNSQWHQGAAKAATGRTQVSAFSLLSPVAYQLCCIPVVWNRKAMNFVTQCNFGARIGCLGTRLVHWLSFAAVALTYLSSPPLLAMEETLTVTIDQAKLVKVPAGIEALVVGNAAVADVTLLKQGSTMIITGKGFGETNFIALDGAGNSLAQSLIRVVGGKNGLLVQRGMDRQSYACAPQCLPTAKLGDEAKYFSEVAGQVKDHNAHANGLP